MPTLDQFGSVVVKSKGVLIGSDVKERSAGTLYHRRLDSGVRT